MTNDKKEMKEDKLEKYIRDNRAQFDDAEPSDEVWNKISGNLEKGSRRKIPWLRISWQVAAAVIIFFTAWYLKGEMQRSHSAQSVAGRKDIHLYPVMKDIQKENSTEQNQKVNYANTSNNNTIINNSAVMKQQSSDSLPSELIEATQYYAAQISKTRSLMKNCASYNKDIDKQVNADFDELDTEYNSLRNDLKDNIDNKEVLEAMILNYRTRLEILENIMQQLETTADCNGQIK